MLEQLKDKYYKFEEQIKVYDRHKSQLTDEDKYTLINKLFLGRDFWGFFELITKITYDLADDSDRYLELLERINNKIKNDMAQGPFLNILSGIGENKPEIAVKLYEKIIKESKNVDFNVISGLILGGYSKKNNTLLQKYLKKKIEYPLTNSIFKAILVKYEHSKLTTEIYSYFNKVSKTKSKEILREHANICLIFYKRDRTYFFKQITNLIKIRDINISYLIFDRLAYRDILNQKQVFELVDISKDLDEVVVDKIVEVLKKYPSQHKQISEWFIYWLNKDLEFKLRHFDWVLEELVKNNKLFIRYFLENYKKIKNKKSNTYIFILPHLFRTLSKYHSDYALNQLFKFNLLDKDEKYLFFELNKVFLGNIYLDGKNKTILIKLIDNLITIAKKRPFISFNKEKYITKKNKSSFTKQDYDYLIDFANHLLEQLRNRKEKYDFKLIHKKIKKYDEVYKYAIDVIKTSEKNNKYIPLLWLGESEEPKLDDIKISEKDSEINKAFKIDFAMSRFWSQAYLSELNRDLKIISKKPNEKFSKKIDLIKNIKNNFSDEQKFWTYFSELVFTAKLDKYIKIIEPQVPNKPENNMDLKINLFKRAIYFEITRPEMDRNLRLANGAVALGNKSFLTIDKKYRQLFSKKTLDEIEKGKRKDLFFVVLDISNSTIDEYELLNSFLGSLAVIWQIDKSTGKTVNQYTTRKKDSLSDKNKNTEIVSGAIYFKQELIFVNNQPKIRLKGDIISNPNAKNQLLEKEIKKLKEIIFN